MEGTVASAIPGACEHFTCESIMETIRNIVIEEGVPRVELRGRPTSDEYLALLLMDVGKSFVSSKSRDTLYQIARNLGIEVEIGAAGKKTWRVWKRSDRVLRDKKAAALLRRARKTLISKGPGEYALPEVETPKADTESN